MAEIPTEIIVEILSRLPVKSILRFTCVCKSWYSLIKTPNFIKLHLNQTLTLTQTSNTNHQILLCIESLYYSELNLHYNPNHLFFSELHHPLELNGIVLFGSCNGVVCISEVSNKDIIFLYNPLTQSNLKLPCSQSLNRKNDVMLFGFGYVSKDDDYKVLRIVQGYTANLDFYNEAELYSLNNNSWKSVESIPHYPLFKDYHGVLVNEALHYVVVTEEMELQCKFIASFDLQTERISLLDLPDYDDDDHFRTHLELYLRELNGCLCLMVSYHVNDCAIPLPLDYPLLERADLWIMKEFGKKETWVRLFSICEPESFRCSIQIKPVVYDQVGRRILLEIDCFEFGWYDLESKKFKKFKAHGLPKHLHFDSRSFVGSLVSFEDKVHYERKSLPTKKKKKKDLDNFLSAGFKLRL